MSVTAEDVARLFRVRKTSLKMLMDRGYIVVKEDLEESLESFKVKYGASSSIRDDLTIIAPLVNDPNTKTMVFFGPPKKLGVEDHRGFLARLEANSAKRAIVITPDSATSRFIDAMQKTNSEGSFYFQMFNEKELLVNITEHVLVPKHVPLTNEQLKELLKRYKLKLSQLPRIQATDPIARYFGLTRGQVVKIIRESETAGKYVTYRAVT